MTATMSAFPTPIWLAKEIHPLEWGGKEYRADPWILDMEATILAEFLDTTKESFVKVNAPPQSGKSSYLEVYLPLWILAHFPNTRIILVAYNDRLAEKSGGKVRDLMMAYGPKLFNLDVDPDNASKGKWSLKGYQGGMISVGIGSSVTGESADVLIIGDVIKNMKEAASRAVKDAHWDEWDGTLKTRLQNPGLALIGSTRWADDDISGRIDAQLRDPAYDGDPWITLNYAALAEPEPHEEYESLDTWTDRLGRKYGEPLQTQHSRAVDRENPRNAKFCRIKRSTTPFIFSCLYQGNPTSAVGGMFPRASWGWYDPHELPPIASQRRCWDLAATEGGGDWSVGVKVAMTEDDYFLILDSQRFRKGPAEVKAHVELTAGLDGLGCPYMIEQERSGAGKTTFAFYKAGLSPHTVEPAIPDGTKEERAKPYSTLQQMGRILLPRWLEGHDESGLPIWTSPQWVEEFIIEHSLMMGDGRSGQHDDQIDCAAYAINDMYGTAGAMMIETGLMMTGSGQMISVLEGV